MIGCRPLCKEELDSIISSLSLRDATLVILGVKTGFRISELLSIRVNDVFQYDRPLDRVSVARRHMKGSQSSRSVPLHTEAKAAIQALIITQCLEPQDYLFQSNKGNNKAISRIQAYRAIRAAAAASELTGAIATHSLRKTFAKAVHKALKGDLVRTQRAMGHKSISSTVAYLSFLESDIDDAILE